ncbi:MAG: sensor histidine kinase [Fervidobacterium sp.]
MKIVLFLQLLVLVIFVFSMYLLPSSLYFISLISIFIVVNTTGLSYYAFRVWFSNFKDSNRFLKLVYFVLLIISVAGFSLLFFNLFKLWLENYPQEAIADFLNTLLVISTFLLVAFGIAYLTLKRELESKILENEQLKQARLSLELESLKSKVNPHFLFNTLATAISMLELNEDTEKIKKYLSDVSCLLRMSVDSPEVWTINQEIELARRYLNINKVRLGEKFDFEIDVSRECSDEKIPALLLQPLVENAIVHGITKSKTGGKVYILCKRTDDKIVIEVKDTGVGAKKIESGTGISLVEQRLRLFSKGAKLEVNSEVGKGTIIRIYLLFGGMIAE